MATLDPATVSTREGLSEFLSELAQRIELGTVETVNVSAHQYIDAAAGWTADLEGYFLNRGESAPPEPTWSLVASIFLAATVYE